jgi:antitoxin component YwqK of YwqJK toxin-antitoxin module
LNICLLIFLISCNESSPAPFEPFHNITDIEYTDLIDQHFEQIPVDVIMLGKTVKNLTIGYEFNDDGKCTWRNSIINLDSKEVDTLGIYNIIESYNADILSTYRNSDVDSEFDNLLLASPFFVQHRTNHLIFKCVLDSFRTGMFEISCSFSPPIENDSLIKQELTFWDSQKRFGPDTTIYEDGQVHIENYFNWQVHGEDKWFRPDGSIETIRFYNQGTNTKTLRYYPDGQLKSNVLSYNLTGKSRWFYQGGQLKEVIRYRDGERYGEHIKYYSNGLIEFKGSYNGGNLKKGFYDNGIKDGTWNFYDSLGAILKADIYQNGSIINE